MIFSPRKISYHIIDDKYLLKNMISNHLWYFPRQNYHIDLPNQLSANSARKPIGVSPKNHKLSKEEETQHRRRFSIFRNKNQLCQGFYISKWWQNLMSSDSLFVFKEHHWLKWKFSLVLTRTHVTAFRRNSQSFALSVDASIWNNT
jgi:hypothetical protein